MTPKHLILIDAGHGIHTPGKRSPYRWSTAPAAIAAAAVPADSAAAVPAPALPNGVPMPDAALAAQLGDDTSCLIEARSNRDLARRIRDGLLERGYDARLVVPEDEDIPLTARLRRIRDLCNEHTARGGIWPNRLLISIHSNAAPATQSPAAQSPAAAPAATSPATPAAAVNGCGHTAPSLLTAAQRPALTASGWECWVQGSSWNSHHLADLLGKRAMELLPAYIPIRTPFGNLRNLSHRPNTHIGRSGDLFLLKNAPCTAVLTENLFMDNAHDACLLLHEPIRQALAQLHIDAIDDFLVGEGS